MPGLCPHVPVHKGITVVFCLFRSHRLSVIMYCLVFCIGSRVPVHEDRKQARMSVLTHVVGWLENKLSRILVARVDDGRRDQFDKNYQEGPPSSTFISFSTDFIFEYAFVCFNPPFFYRANLV